VKKIALASVTVIALLALAVSGCGPAATPTAPPPPPTGAPTAAPEATPTEVPTPEPVVGVTYKIGFAPDVTGAGSNLGVPERNVAEIIKARLEEAGGVLGPDNVLHPVEIIIGDSETNPDTAAGLARRYIEEDEAVALVMGSLTSISLAISGVAQEAEVPYVSMASAGVIVKNPDTGEVYKWVFKSPQGNFEVAQWQVERLTAMGATKVCYLYENTGYGKDCFNNSSAQLTAAGFEKVFDGTFEQTDTQFPQVPGIQAAGCDVVVIGAIPPGAALAHAAIRAAMPDIPIIHGHGVCTQDFITAGGDPINDAEMPCSAVIIAEEVPADNPQKAVFMDFKTAYEEYTGKPVSTFGGHAWDALYWVVDALKSVPDGLTLQEQRAAVRDYIENNIKNWPGTAGVFTLSPEDHCGIDWTSFTWFRVEDQKFVPFPQEEW
jgi:branched-chain amino acid transport system substrate-binding protein